MKKAQPELKVIGKADFSGGMPDADHEHCRFVQCNFSQADLSGASFSGCVFEGCNLSLATLDRTAFRDAQFRDCKIVGTRFSDCNAFLFFVRFTDCVLDFSSFYRMKLKQTVFSGCSLQEADFAGADLTGAVLDKCDLLRATFDQTVLEGADLRTAYHYTIDPELNRIRKAKFSAEGLAGLLARYDIEIG